MGLCVILLLDLQSQIMNRGLLLEFPQTTSIVIAKFISTMVLHWICLPQIRCALATMKFAVNHSYRFDTPVQAYIGAMLHLSAAVAVEILNMASLLTVYDLWEFIRDFTALVVIADFEMLLATAVNEDCLKLLIGDKGFAPSCLNIQRTSSARDAGHKEPKARISVVENWIKAECLLGKKPLLITLTGANKPAKVEQPEDFWVPSLR